MPVEEGTEKARLRASTVSWKKSGSEESLSNEALMKRLKAARDR